MSDEQTQRDGAASPTLACAAGVTPARLSAWRDGLLPAEQAAVLATHVATCPACAERQRDYEQIGDALRRQLIPQSETDPWPPLERALARERRVRHLPAIRAEWGGAGALVAALLLIALFAGLLVQRAAQRPAAHATATATSAATAGSWTTLSAYVGLSGVLVAPSDPRVAYQVLTTQQKGSPTSFTLRRTDDEGANWRDLALPYIPNATVDIADGPFVGFVSPLNSQVVFLILGALATTSCPDNGFSTGLYCQLEYVSVDGGSAWQPLTLPTSGLITALLVGQGSPMEAVAGSMRPQGSRLYADVVNQLLGQEVAPPPGRLVMSDNGGSLWREIDAPIVADGQGVYDFAPTPTGATIYVASAPLGHPTAPPTLWRSDDAGGSWLRLGAAPNATVISLRAAADPQGGSLLYLLTAQSDGRLLIQASRDGQGCCFTVAPSLGATGYEGATFLAILPDGSLAIAYNGAVASWNLLHPNADWRTLAPAADLVSYTAAFTQTQPDGSTLLWLAGDTQSEPVVEVTRLPK